LRTLAIAFLAALLAAPAADAALDIQAHRGGTLKDGKPVQPENALPAFQAAKAGGASVLEMDVHVSQDGVPFLMHDGSLDRTTDCAGPVSSLMAAELDNCHVDILGTTDVFTQVPGATVPVPRLSAVLGFAKTTDVALNIEINNYPDASGYDTTGASAKATLDAIDASGIDKSRILIQSFLEPNLAPAEQRGFSTALITFKSGEAGAIAMAQQNGNEVIEPEWPVDDPAAYVSEAHGADVKVVPYTINAASDVLAARKAGVDGIITDDPPLTRRTLLCDDSKRALGKARKRYAAARAAARAARTRKQKRRAAARVKAAKRKLAAAEKAKTRACRA
jgi:glycerophosphoryl diester phosphodiesterase